ncbi:hypothetical protein T492DRAFT_957873 [Pavlovales sp. CCMP2436]|nr:hypothetical protein T492DRAFT_957873 [Pavlovales sp. CCMP2436]|mmetsp:Transcript_11959/g.30128  ORF Transcript_11959/g.30128 Transcript_11959/m.30128 type:complete len:223 (+) Transcript_11959:98-766(+)
MNPSFWTALASGCFLWAAVGDSWIVATVGGFNGGIPVHVAPGGVRMKDGDPISFHSQLCFDDCTWMATAGDAAKIVLYIGSAVMACASFVYASRGVSTRRWSRFGPIYDSGVSHLRGSLLLLMAAAVIAAAGTIFFLATCAVAAHRMDTALAPAAAPWAKFIPSSSHQSQHKIPRPGLHLLILMAGFASAVGGGSRLRTELRATEGPSKEETASLRAGFLGV